VENAAPAARFLLTGARPWRSSGSRRENQTQLSAMMPEQDVLFFPFP
jgi:hypothetical protein